MYTKGMDKKTYYLVASAAFFIIAVAHLLRAIYSWEAVIDGVVIPLWFSWVAVVLAGYLSVRGWQFAQKKGK